MSRNPIIHNSHIQKVRFVHSEALAHFKDVVVFPSRGPRPLAGKLSGGDYDGDKFWICWDEDLVAPFTNAPAPWEPVAYAELGILKDSETLGDIIGEQCRTEDVKRWIQKCTAGRLEQSQLGQVTLLHAIVTYHDGDIASRRAEVLADLHDHLGDADKNGYSFTTAALMAVRRMLGVPREMPKPAHWPWTRKDGGGEDVPKTQKPGDCIDELYINTIEPEITQIMSLARVVLKDARAEDADLSALYDDLLQDSDPVIQASLKDPSRALQPVAKEYSKSVTRWIGVHKGTTRGNAEWDKIIEDCRKICFAAEPVDRNQSIIKEWLRRIGKAPTIWERIRISAFYTLDRKLNDGKMVFMIAGGELCQLKAQSLDPNDSRTVAMPLYEKLKAQKC